MQHREQAQTVVVTDIRIPFWSMVVLMVKWAIAAIPAVAILFIIYSAGVALVAVGGEAYSDYKARAEVRERERAEVRERARAEDAEAAKRRADAVERSSSPRPALNGRTASEEHCAAAGGDYNQCLQAERRCAGSYDHDKCIAEDKRLNDISAARRARERSGASQ